MAGNSNSGNRNSQGKTAKKGSELVQRTRAAILNAMDALDDRSKPLSQLLADAAEKQPLRFLDMAAKHCPKDVNLDVINTLKADKLSDEELADIIATRAKARREKEQAQPNPLKDAEAS